MARFIKGSYGWTAVDYAKRVVAGRIDACWQVKAGCQRFLDDIKRPDLIFDAISTPTHISAADHACDFISNLPHVIGPLSGEPIKLEPFQVFILVNLFGLIDRATRLRKYREAFVLLPRGNAKSTLAAGIAIYMTFCLGEGGAQSMSGATSLKQANAVFAPARSMVMMTPALADALGLEIAAKSIYQPSSQSSFQPVKANTEDGGLPWCAIADELHQAISGTQLQAFRTGMGKRRGSDPLLLIISTAGVNVAGVCRQEQLYFEDVLKGAVTDDAKFALIYTIDKGDSWRDFKVWKKANPNYGVSVDEAHLRREYDRALQSPAAQAECRTKYLNEWVSSASGWLNQVDWADAAGEVDYEALKGRPAGIGVDLSTMLDLTSVTVSVVREDGTRVLVPYSWVPSGSIQRSKSQQAYAQWIETGDLLASDGPAIDLVEIREKIEVLCQHFRVTGIYFDPKDAAQMQQELIAQGHPVTTFAQNAMNYTPVMAQFEADLAAKKLVHPGNKVLDWCAGNLSVRNDRNSNMHPQKPDKQDHLKIDTMIAALMAFAASQEEAPAPDAPPIFFF